ncbi:hypothetical protein [Halorubellus litoreus]|uniref:Uncharacterized protein n=1 Tax=Halorubellus litoreus TaxID=755308 RepID=A0ABD5VDF2_9EURY
MGKSHKTPAKRAGKSPVAYRDERWALPSDSMAIRRYKSREHFKTLVEEEELYFGAARKYHEEDFDDTEGQATDATREAEDAGTPLSAFAPAEYLEDLRQNSIGRFFLNCWKLGRDENHQHWDEFGEIAIETTVGRLRKAISYEYQLYMGMVRYVDDLVEIPSVPEAAYFYKLLEFASENEFRVVLDRDPQLVFQPSKEPPDWDYDDSLSVDIDVEQLITQVIVRPSADNELVTFVQNTLADNGLDVPVKRSRLDWNRDPAPCRMVYGNQNIRLIAKHWNKLLTREIARTSTIWDGVDLVEVVPPGQETENFAHYEIHRFKDSDVPDPADYGHDYLNYSISVRRFNQDGLQKEWKRGSAFN